MQVKISDIQRARERLKGIIKETAIDKSFSAGKLLGAEVYLKMENEQLTGSFKIRGALSKISSLSAEERARGVVASSAGNHAQGVAYSATKMGVSSKIVMPEMAPLIKIDATRGYGAEVVLHGSIYDEAFERAKEIELQEKRIFVHPYQDEQIIAGQGTIGLELFEKLPDLDSVVVPIGGGGLISGIAIALKSLKPSLKVYGVQSTLASSMEQLFHGKIPTMGPTHRRVTIADGIAVKKASEEMYHNFLKHWVDDIVTVTDEQIAEAIFFLIERAKAVVEGSGAASLAAAMAGKIPLGKKTCFVLSGGNIDLNIIGKVIDLGLIRKGRLTEISVVVPDIPGLLSQMTDLIAKERANILQVHHDRVERDLQLREARIDFLLETTSHEHAERVRMVLKALDGVRLL
jgi:threonine dehydratase